MEYATLRDSTTGSWHVFQHPVDVLSTRDLGRVRSLVESMEREVETAGVYAVGFVAYEAAPAFDSALLVHRPVPELPLVHFGLYRTAQICDRPPAFEAGTYTIGECLPSMDRGRYLRSVAAIREHIARGDTYQVNLSYRLRADFDGSTGSFFLGLHGAQQASCAAYLDLGSHAVCSASPELFFSLDGECIRCRPMKGTSPRGHDLASDRRLMASLQSSVKNRAENTMIVDMVRNDLGRIASVGTVHVPERYDVERYPTVLQMTSTVEARTGAPVSRIIAALFPSASITGAPKVSTMAIIRGIESDPRGVYTGAIGYIAPGRRAHFNVAIRTAVIDRTANTLEYGVGGGIVWDSDAVDEYSECSIKARILTAPPPAFDLLETLLWEPGAGYFLLERHLRRLGEAAEFFVRPTDFGEIRHRLLEVASKLAAQDHRVRLAVAADGSLSIESARLRDAETASDVRIGLATEPISATDPFLRFKTTQRSPYQSAIESRPDCDDVVLWNERGEITESTVANIVVVRNGRHATPPTSSGLLPGTYRAELLDLGAIEERVLTRCDLEAADDLYLINSVRRRINVRWIG